MSFEHASHGSFRLGLPSRDEAGVSLDNLRSQYYQPLRQTIQDIQKDYVDQISNQGPRQPGDMHVGVIGAGMAGLLSAYILKKAGFKVTVFEVDDRVGGRVHTHYFDKSKNWQYGDLGAMRLPCTTEHQRVFNVIDELNKVNKENEDRKIELIDYILENDDGRTFFNNTKAKDKTIMTNKYAKDHPFELGFHLGPLPLDIQTIWDSILQYFLPHFQQSFRNGLQFLMQFDTYSVREFIVHPPPLLKLPLENVKVEQFMEGYTSATGLFRLGIVDTILEVKGGMQRLAEAFLPSVEDSIKYKHSVQKLEISGKQVGITYAKVEDNKNQFPSLGHETDFFDHVIVTCPLGVVRHWDLPDDLSLGKRTAIRSLNYDNSVKVFLRFTTRFWEDPKKTDPPIYGGQSTTDLSIRKIVYPSYGMHSDEPGVLLVSYTWANDAAKFGANSHKDVAELALRDVVKIHGEVARTEYLDYVVHYWSTDPITGGGTFAYFEPGQFSSMLPDLKRPEHNIHFAGEHTDFHHAWIVGAFNSALHATESIMKGAGLGGLFADVAKPFINEYSVSSDVDQTE
ncbi:hypothetical protein BC937DRAFT_94916 [Endogone sp. FLAS-F59071]|nr:hypothetical protein BC937DRAFT_94916 [Endogone sp. FLAS-F59071]|eukprot:RUS13692.1 hypothetical protein BC937DRAFT_94916 [Endogone sp. FLAS-F59071]